MKRGNLATLCQDAFAIGTILLDEQDGKKNGAGRDQV